MYGIIYPMKQVLITSLFLAGFLAFFTGSVDAATYDNCNSRNRSPIVSGLNSRSVHLGDVVNMQLNVSDPDNDGLSVYMLEGPYNATFDRYNFNFSWIPDEVGRYNITFRVFDSFCSYIDKTVVIQVDNKLPDFGVSLNTSGTSTYYNYYNNQSVCSNIAPAFSNFNPLRIAKEGSLYTSYALALSSGDAVTYRLVSAPDGMIINPSTGLISWTPNYAQGRTGAYTVTIAASNCFREVQTSYYLVVTDVQFEVPVEKPIYKPAPKPAPKCSSSSCGNTTTTTTTTTTVTTSCSTCGTNGGATAVTNDSNNTNSNLNLRGLSLGQTFVSLVSFIALLVSIVFSPGFLVFIILILIYRNWKNRKKSDLKL